MGREGGIVHPKTATRLKTDAGGSLMAVAEAQIKKPIPFDTKHLDKLMDDAGIDVLVAT